MPTWFWFNFSTGFSRLKVIPQYCIAHPFCTIPWMSKKKYYRQLKNLLPKMLTFTPDLNLTTPKRRTPERLFVNSDPTCTFLPRNIKLEPWERGWSKMYLLSHKNSYFLAISASTEKKYKNCRYKHDINSMCLATDSPKRSGIQKRIRTLWVPLHGFLTHLWRVMTTTKHW